MREVWESRSKDIEPLLRRMNEWLMKNEYKKAIYLSVDDYDDYVNNSLYVTWSGKTWYTDKEVRVCRENEGSNGGSLSDKGGCYETGNGLDSRRNIS